MEIIASALDVNLESNQFIERTRFTPAGSPSAAYLEPHVAGSYVVAG